MEVVWVKHKHLKDIFTKILVSLKVDERVCFHVVEGLIQTSLRGVDSHGIRLFPHYVRVLEAGRINGRPKYKFYRHGPSVGRLDADHTYGHAAGAKGMKYAISMATKTGVGAVSIFNSSHFGAAAYCGLMAAEADMIGITLTHADALLLTANGKKAFFGTNPICVTAPVKGEDPFCLDMATSKITWNKVKIHREQNKLLEPDVAADSEGNVTRDPFKVVSLLPIGDYKGFGLSMVIDILCALLSGMPFGKEISSMYLSPLHEKRFLGQFVMALDIARFVNVNTFKRRLKKEMDMIRRQPAKNPRKPVMVPGDPEKLAFKERLRKGIPVSKPELKAIEEICKEQGIKFNI